MYLPMYSYQHILQHVLDTWASAQDLNQQRTEDIDDSQRLAGKQRIGKRDSIV